MSFNFDQFNSNSLTQRDPISRSSEETQIVPSGYVQIKKNDETQIFRKQKMNISLPANINFLNVSNDNIAILMSAHLLFRMNMSRADSQTDVSLEKFIVGQRVSRMFLDQTGNHLLLSLVPKSSGYSSELMYLNRNSNKPKILTKFRDHEITAIGFNCENTSSITTGNILLGTSKGYIFEADIGLENDRVIQNNFRQAFDIGRGEKGPVTGIGVHRAQKTNNFIVLVSTLDRLYKFHECLNDDKSLSNIFKHYMNVPEEARDYEQQSSKLSYSQMDFILENKYPRGFGWLTEAGIFYGEINQIADNPNFILSKKTITFPEQDNDYRTASYISKHQNLVPSSFVLTDFHILLQYSDHVTAISLISHEIVYDEYFSDQHGKLMAIIKDVKNGNVYTFSNKTIFKYKIHNEKRNVWRIYLDKKEFELAEKYSRDNPAHYDIVLSRIGDDFYERKLYIDASRVYSQTKKSFEEVTLKFMQVNENLPLIYYLKSRLNDLNPATEKTQITMLVVWLVDLYLTEINRSSLTSLERQKEYDEFLLHPHVQTCLKDNRKVIYDIIASHGDNYNLTSLTTMNEDYEDVINHYIQQNEYRDALDTLKIPKRADLIYQFAPIIIEELPKETIQMLMDRGRGLNAVKLLPTLLCIKSDKHRTEVVRYLEFAIHSLSVQDQSIHNYLIQLYAKYKDCEKLMSYFETQGKELSMIHYDVHYALRLCKEFDVKEACVFLMCILEFWQQAVELSLTFDSKLAQQTASQPNDRELKRKLWLTIAEYEIRRKENVQEALELLRTTDLLRIEDLLPFFPDFQKIDHFKEAICDSLKEYNRKIHEQRKEMEESAEAAENVRKSIQAFKNRSVTISGQDKCSYCGVFLLLKPFFLFPCSHKFHSDCLEKNLLELFSMSKFASFYHSIILSY
ncbi:hypothetical protein ACKWTF_005444 [Chironomus riparius]